MFYSSLTIVITDFTYSERLPTKLSILKILLGIRKRTCGTHRTIVRPDNAVKRLLLITPNALRSRPEYKVS